MIRLKIFASYIDKSVVLHSGGTVEMKTFRILLQTHFRNPFNRLGTDSAVAALPPGAVHLVMQLSLALVCKQSARLRCAAGEN